MRMLVCLLADLFFWLHESRTTWSKYVEYRRLVDFREFRRKQKLVSNCDSPWHSPYCLPRHPSAPCVASVLLCVRPVSLMTSCACAVRYPSRSSLLSGSARLFLLVLAGWKAAHLSRSIFLLRHRVHAAAAVVLFLSCTNRKRSRPRRERTASV